MSFLVSKPERIRVSVSILLSLLFLFSEEQSGSTVGGLLCDVQNHAEVRDVGSKAGIAASTPEKRACRQRLTRDTEYTH